MKKIISLLMAILLLITTIPLSNISATEISPEDFEVNSDNWSLGLSFFDSSVNGGKTALNKIEWDASDGTYYDGAVRVIKTQVTFKKLNAEKYYSEGNLQIKIPILTYGADNANIDVQITVYDNKLFTYEEENGYYIFTYKGQDEEDENFEGTIDIEYSILPKQENPEQFLDSCTHTFNKELTAVLSATDEETEILNSNTISFIYSRIYTHPWEKSTYTITKTPEKVMSYDGLGSTAANYIWVKYIFKTTGTNGALYPIIGSNDYYIEDTLSEGCIVKDTSYNTISPVEGNTYRFYFSSVNSSISYLIGYPKSIYNEENDNLKVVNYCDLYAKYKNAQDYEKVADASANVNLNEYKFSYDGELYGMTKSVMNDSYYGEEKKLFKEALTGEDLNVGSKGTIDFYITPQIYYSGETMNIKIGDDLLFITDENSEYRKLEDDEYYFSKIYFPYGFLDGNGATNNNLYLVELWVRKAGNTEYEKINSFISSSSAKVFTFTQEDAITGYYFFMKDVDLSIRGGNPKYPYSSAEYYYPYGLFVNQVTINNAKSIADTGTVYNFALLEVYDPDNNLLNSPDLSGYDNTMTKMDIGNYDLNTYGHYVQRASATRSYTSFQIANPSSEMQINKKMTIGSTPTEDAFLGNATISVGISDYGQTKITYNELKYHSQDIPVDKKINGYEIYDLLPLGMEVTSTPSEIVKNIILGGYSYKFSSLINTPQVSTVDTKSDMKYIVDNSGKFLTANEFLEIIKSHTTCEIIGNWNNTGRTMLKFEVDLSDNPLIIINTCAAPANYRQSGALFSFKYNYEIAIDSYLEYGGAYTNVAYGEFKNSDIGLLYTAKDNLDINSNEDDTEYLSYSSASVTINYGISTYQSLNTQVQTDQTSFTSKTANASNESEYFYKLKVTNVGNDIGGLVIYDALETAYNENDYWQGEFIGIDTSYAESKGYTVKVYYSENESPGYLTEDKGWVEYSDTVDKTKIKSLAFKFLDSEGNDAVIPSGSVSYVLIEMKAPADKEIKTLAYNKFWTEWSALDINGQVVEFIYGLQSNTTKVFLPNSTEDKPIININFTKEIEGTDEAFDFMKLDKDEAYNFIILLKDTETNNIYTGILNSKGVLTFTNLNAGIYEIYENEDNYFDFVDMLDNNSEETIIEGITFEKQEEKYILTISEDIKSDSSFNIKVVNKIEDNHNYEEKEEKANLFSINKIENDI